MIQGGTPEQEGRQKWSEKHPFEDGSQGNNSAVSTIERNREPHAKDTLLYEHCRDTLRYFFSKMPPAGHSGGRRMLFISAYTHNGSLTGAWGRPQRFPWAYWGTSWQSCRRTSGPACWPGRRRPPCPPTCRGRPASRRERWGTRWDNRR